MGTEVGLTAEMINFPPTDAQDMGLRIFPGGPEYPFHHNLQILGKLPRPPGPAALSFLSLALAVWAADKLHPRQAAADAWTRTFRLTVPVAAAAAAWTALTPALNFLTGDRWHWDLRPAAFPWEYPKTPVFSWQPDAVCLFSGGMDSLAGAIERLEAGDRLLLVSHHDYGQLASCQAHLAKALIEHYGPARVQHLPLRVQFPEAPEASLRSRSLLFVALGVAAADTSSDDTPVVIPENGWIGLNPPLTGSRVGSYSTRTTHPYFLGHLEKVLASAGLSHSLVNPYHNDTKGEVLRRSPNPTLLRRLLPATISCAHPAVFRWQQERQGNCGYCYPCLVRRAALHARGWDKIEGYAYDVLTDEAVLKNRRRGADLRSLLYALGNYEQAPKPAQLLLKSGPVQLQGEAGAARLRLVAEGLAELTRWLHTQGGPHILNFATLREG